MHVLILLLVRRLESTETIGQYLNWDSKKAFKIALLFLKERNFAILEDHVTFGWLCYKVSEDYYQ